MNDKASSCIYYLIWGRSFIRWSGRRAEGWPRADPQSWNGSAKCKAGRRGDRGRRRRKWTSRHHSCPCFLKSRALSPFANLAWKLQSIDGLVGRLILGKITIDKQPYRKVKCGPRYGWATKSVSPRGTSRPAEIVKKSRGNTASLCQYPGSDDCPTVTRRRGVKGMCEVPETGPAPSL